MQFFASILATLLIASGIYSETTKQDHSDKISLAQRTFNGPFMKALDHRAKQTNVIVSTYALHSALSFLMAGAKGQTYQELSNALGYQFTQFEQQSLLEGNKDSMSNLMNLRSYGATLSNLLVVQENMRITESFQAVITENFNAQLMEKNFTRNAIEATNEINDFVKSATKGKIEKLFDKPLLPDTRAVIVNAIHFKSPWLNQFRPQESFKSTFKLADGTVKNDVTYMTISALRLKKAKYSKRSGFSVLHIPFDADGNLWFRIILPDEISSNMDCCTMEIDSMYDTEDRDIHLTLPKFAIEQSHTALNEILQSMGIKSIFDESSANLSGITGVSELFVSVIAQKATITIDENGVEASAATGINMITPMFSPPLDDVVEFNVNRPFLFSISTSNNVDLFTGIIYSP